MDKENANLIVHVAVGSKRNASLFVAVPSIAGAADASEAAAGGSQIPAGWDPYEEVSYESPPNPYDTFMDDPWNEVTTACFLFYSHSSLNPIFAGVDG